jgi:hypothetical protein
MPDHLIQDIERQLSEINVRLIDADGDEYSALRDQEDELLARQRSYKAAPTSGDRQSVAREIKDAMNAAQQRVDALDAAPPADSQQGRLQRNIEREQAAATAVELERRLQYAGHDDEGLATALEDAEIRMEELRDQAARHHPNDTRTRRAQREYQAGQLRVAEIQREVNLRQGLAAAAKLQEKTNNSIADYESKVEWKRVGERKIAEAAQRVESGEPSWLLDRARSEAKALPPPELLERKRREVAERG